MQAYDAPTSQQILLTLDKDLFRDFFCVLKLLKILFCAIEFIDLGYPLMNCELGAWFHYFSFLGVTRMRCVYWNHGEEVSVCMSGRQCQAYHDFTSHGPFPWFQWGALFYFPLTKQHHSFGQNTAALHWLPTTVPPSKKKRNFTSSTPPAWQHQGTLARFGTSNCEAGDGHVTPL